ncbi:acyl-CoA dehydrogenase family protein [Thalassococcus sp. S3]|uniref:acyl-CoA dehydrogenase family protein n=1 Tax=Thalassococcus sp. S3 TaxID=2017482 RepID=UPI0010242053|nr:acyl-CoA dehydrogenase family protein [Thalassococcus sp. S3]QBF29666.1 diaminopimelate decarboxylase [Thalassococcus sp. S3]
MAGFSLNSAETARLRSVADRVGTPFYVYDAQALRDRVAALKAALPDVDFFYSLKANPNLSVVGVLTSAGTGAEVSSRLELETALAAGARPERILMVGPGKSADELERAVSLGIKAIVVESIEELADIDRLAAFEGRIQSVALRVNPDFQVSGARLAMSGRATQFGIDQSDLQRAVACVETLPHLRLAGLHIYMGTRILSEETLEQNTRQVLALAEELMPNLSWPLDFVDVGGGFGVPYYEDEQSLDLDKVGAVLRPVIDGFRSRNSQTRVAIELGRYMVAEAGLFVAGIRRVKTTKGENFAVCDGGSNVHSAAAGQGFMRRNFPVSLVPNGPRDAATAEKWTFTGPLCTPMDVIASAIEIPAPQEGDLICIHQSGGYGPSASPVDFLGFGAPAEVMADGDTLTVAKERPDWQSRLATQTPRAIPMDMTGIAAAPAAPFDHPALDRLSGLRPLFEMTGNRLETDPGAWADLWANPTVRALTTIGVPDDYNGFPLSQTDLGIEDCPHALHVALVERLARFDPSCILALPGPSLSGGAVLAAGNPAQIERFFAPYRTGPQGTFFAVTEPDVGSDASNGSTVVREAADGSMTLSGTKMLVGGIARARIGLVFARMETTGRAALVMIEPQEVADYISIERLPTNGLCGADLCRLEMHDVPVTNDMLLGAASSGGGSLRDGFMAINGVFERYRPVVAALALGNARGILDRLEKASACGGFADMQTRYTALLNRLARVLEDYANGRPRSHRISELKFQAIAFSDELVMRVAAEAPGAMLSDTLLRRKMRDAKAFEYMEGTSNIHLLNAFRAYVAEVPA